MTTRDRIFLIVLVAAVALVGTYFLLVSPERKQAATLGVQVATEQSQVQAAQGKKASAEAARAKYPDAYATVVKLGKAVPPSSEEPSLIYQLDHLATAKGTDLVLLDSSGVTAAAAPAPAPAAAAPASGTAATPASGTSAATPVAGAPAAPAFTSKTYTLQFSGSFFDLYHVLNSLNAFTVDQGSGELNVSGRLLTVTTATLTPSAGQLTGAIGVTAYYLPVAQGLTAGASPGAPAAGTTGASPATPAGGVAPAATTPAPAVVKATP
jgi:hypothetical protein